MSSVILLVLDGWGLAAPGAGNAIYQANAININRFWASFPHTQLLASGEAVGLPHNEPGNTETGHLNLGAGRIVYQDLARINMAIADGTFFKNQALLGAFEHAKKRGSCVHLMGLVGSGGVHANNEHLFALIQMAAKLGFKNLCIHLFTDGRDSPPTAAKTYIQRLREVIQNESVGQIVSIMGRYWAMDRDLRWERTSRAYFALTKGIGHLVKTPEEAIDLSYENGVTDEFVEPSLVTDNTGKPLSLIKEGDAVIFYNFRIDRPRQLTKAFITQDFAKAGQNWGFDPYAYKYGEKVSNGKPVAATFDRGPRLANLYFVTMTEYSRPLVEEGAQVAFPPEKVEMPLGRVVSTANLRQLRVAESEKERFVTFYFNGQIETAFAGEDRFIIPSPKVATYDLLPEMSARQVTDSLIEKAKPGTYPFILVNFANPDMVGHTGNIGAAVRACEVVDECVGKLANFALAYDATLLITADHGNAEEMINSRTGEIETEHSANPVPFIAISKKFLGKSIILPTGILADVAPTVLSLMSLALPGSMTGRNLLKDI
jgi:2,3-bisphosphoglycerate-independent phosphoglycerate mutase